MARTRCGGARWVVCAALMAGLGMMTGARGARAEGPPPAAKADQSKQAELLLEEGLSEIRARRWSKARTFLLGAFRAQRHWRIAAHLGRVEMELGRMRDAAEHLTFLLHERRDLPAADRAQVLKMLAQARAKVGAVMVTVSPAGAEVLVDGEVVGVAPLVAPVFVEAGGHRVEVRAEGYERGEQAMVVGPGREIAVNLLLTASPKTLTVVDRGDASRGAGRGATGSNKVLLIVGGAATGAAAVASLGLMAGSFIKASERDKLPCGGVNGDGMHYGCAPEAVQADKARQSLANASFNSLLVAGAVGAATLTYWLATRKAVEHKDVKGAVLVGPGGAAASVTVSW